MSRPRKGEHTATMSAASVNASEISPRLQPNVFASGCINTPKVKTTTEPNPANVPEHAAASTSQRRPLPASLRGRLRTARVAINCRSFRALPVGFITHRMHAACIDPPVIEIEERAYGDRIIDRFVRITGCMQCLNIARPDGNGIMIHLAGKPEQRLFRIRKLRGFDICQNP